MDEYQVASSLFAINGSLPVTLYSKSQGLCFLHFQARLVFEPRNVWSSLFDLKTGVPFLKTLSFFYWASVDNQFDK